MLSFLKWIGACFFITLPFASALFLGSSRAVHLVEDSSLSLSKLETRVAGIANGMKRRFAARVETGSVEKSFRASDPRHFPVRDEFLKRAFSSSGGVCRCALLIDAQPRTVEIQGLTLRGPFPTTIDKTEAFAGVQSRLRYDFGGSAHRVEQRNLQWSDWQEGLPPELEGVTLVLLGNDWRVEPSSILTTFNRPGG